MKHYCKPMKRHFITKATGNAATALSMAMEVWCKEAAPEDVQDLVRLMDSTALKLIAACERHAYARTVGATPPAPSEE